MGDRRVVHGDGDDLVVDPLVVAHEEPADRPSPHDRERHDRLLHEDEHVQRVAVARVRLRDEAVVGRVMHRRVEDAIEHQEPGLLVQLVLALRPLRDLDDDGEEGVPIVGEENVMKRVGHGCILGFRSAGWVSEARAG